MPNLMVDLETLGTSSNAVILSIGAVEFDSSGIGRTFYAVIDPQSCVEAGLTVDVSTVMWWMKQSEEARAALSADNPIPLLQALTALELFIGGVEYQVWGNGATFDNVLLSNAYKAVKLAPPWKFYNDRCFRTLKNLYPQITPKETSGVAHNALDDAVYQAQHAVQIFKHLNGELK